MNRRYLMDPWRDALLLQLRLRSVSGPAIGDALAEIDSHCAESGDDPAEAFGDPVEYANLLADSYAEQAGSVSGPSPFTNVAWWQAMILCLSTMLGVSALLNGVDGAVHQAPASLSWGLLVASVALCLVMGIWARMSGRIQRVGIWPFVVLLVLGPLIPVLGEVALPAPAVSMPGWILLLIGVLLLIGAWHPSLGGRWIRTEISGDSVIDPRTGRRRFDIPRGVALIWLVPFAVLGMVTLVAVLG